MTVHHPGTITPEPNHAGEPLVVAGSLRDHTAEHHKRAERSEFQRMLIAGRLPVSGYIGWLEQMLCVYRSLEAHLASGNGAGRYTGVDVEAWRRTPHLERDLAHFGRDATTPSPVPATGALVEQMGRWADGSAPALLGVLYVLEGSTNGSRYIARSLRKAYDLAGEAGLAFMDPYGDLQPERWLEFKRQLEMSASTGDLDGLIVAARGTFDAVTEIGQGLLHRLAA
jgi:heme oxygenase